MTIYVINDKTLQITEVEKQKGLDSENLNSDYGAFWFLSRSEAEEEVQLIIAQLA